MQVVGTIHVKKKFIPVFWAVQWLVRTKPRLYTIPIVLFFSYFLPLFTYNINYDIQYKFSKIFLLLVE
jgi:uncharacterized membrane protein YczE